MKLNTKMKLALIIGGVVIAVAAILGDAFGDLDLDSWLDVAKMLGAALITAGFFGAKKAASGLVLLFTAAALTACGGSCNLIQLAHSQADRVVQAIDEGRIEQARDMAQTAASILDSFERTTCESGGVDELLSPPQGSQP